MVHIRSIDSSRLCIYTTDSVRCWHFAAFYRATHYKARF